jgi:hypothetical protein
MPDVGTILAVQLEARIAKMEREMKRASAIGAREFDKIERRSKLASQRLEQNMAAVGRNAFLGVSRGALAALAPVLSITAAVNGAKQALQAFGDVADNSAAAGIDPEFFQGLAHQAGLGGVSIDQLAKSLADFNRNAGLAVEGKGRMFTALKALNPELLESIRNAISQEQRIRLVTDALDAETDASRRAAIAVAVFGDAGAKLANAFAGGAGQIDVMQQKARDLGLIVDRQLIARADELGDEFDTTTKIVDLQLKQALVNLGPVLVWLTGRAADFAGAINTMVDSLNAIEDRQSSTLEARYNALIAAQDAGLKFSETTTPESDAILAELRRRAVQNLSRQLTSVPPSTSDVPDLDDAGGAGNSAASAAIQNADAVRNLIEQLQLERAAIGQTETQQRLANALRQAGAAATSEQRAEIEALIVSISEQNASLEATGFLQQNVADAFTEFLMGAQSADEAVRSLIGSLARAAIQAALLGDGPFGGLTGGVGLLSGLKLAGGGEVRGPGTSTSDSIPALLSDGEHVVRASEARKHRGLLTAINSGRVAAFAGGGAVGHASGMAMTSSIIVAPNITVEGGSRGEAADAELGKRIGAEIERVVRGVVSSEIETAGRPGNTLNSRGR